MATDCSSSRCRLSAPRRGRASERASEQAPRGGRGGEARRLRSPPAASPAAPPGTGREGVRAGGLARTHARTQPGAARSAVQHRRRASQELASGHTQSATHPSRHLRKRREEAFPGQGQGASFHTTSRIHLESGYHVAAFSRASSWEVAS